MGVMEDFMSRVEENWRRQFDVLDRQLVDFKNEHAALGRRVHQIAQNSAGVQHEEIDALGRAVKRNDEALALVRGKAVDLSDHLARLEQEHKQVSVSLHRDIEVLTAGLNDLTRTMAIQESAHLVLVGHHAATVARLDEVSAEVDALLKWQQTTTAWNALPWWKRWWETIRRQKYV